MKYRNNLLIMLGLLLTIALAACARVAALYSDQTSVESTLSPAANQDSGQPDEQAPVAEITATLTPVSGTVELRRLSEDTYNVVQQTTTLAAGDSVRTGTESQATITFLDDTTTTLFSNTELTVTTLDSGAGTAFLLRLEQLTGITFNKISFPDNSSEFMITTPNGLAAVRGTTFWIEVDRQATSTSLDVLEGTVEFTVIGDDTVPTAVEEETIDIDSDGTVTRRDLDIVCDPACHPPQIDADDAQAVDINTDDSDSGSDDEQLPTATREVEDPDETNTAADPTATRAAPPPDELTPTPINEEEVSA